MRRHGKTTTPLPSPLRADQPTVSVNNSGGQCLAGAACEGLDFISAAVGRMQNRLRRYVSCAHLEHITRSSTPNTRRLVVVPGRAIRRSDPPAADADSLPECCRLGVPIPILSLTRSSRRSTKSKMRAANSSARILCTAQISVDYFTDSSRNGLGWGAGG
jgi:hypothetical protein